MWIRSPGDGSMGNESGDFVRCTAVPSAYLGGREQILADVLLPFIGAESAGGRNHCAGETLSRFATGERATERARVHSND